MAALGRCTCRRRIDHHLKQYAIKSVVTSGAFASSAAATRSLDGCCPSQGARWVSAEIAAYRAECGVCFKDAQVIGISVDAGRIGKPAKELFIGFASCSREGLHAALPPQVGCTPNRALCVIVLRSVSGPFILPVAGAGGVSAVRSGLGFAPLPLVRGDVAIGWGRVRTWVHFARHRLPPPPPVFYDGGQTMSSGRGLGTPQMS